MDETLTSCRKCGRSVPPTSTACPECGYDVAAHDRWRFTWGIPGTIITLTIVLAPIGLPMLWKAYQHRLAAEGTVTAKRSTGNLLKGVLDTDHAAEEWPPWEAPGEFTRGGSKHSRNEDSKGP